MAEPPTLVRNQLFFGRVEEQKQFRAALDALLADPSDEQSPYLFLLYGDGGIGKTTLARRFLDIAGKEEPYRGRFETFRLDWDEQAQWRQSLRVGRELIGAEALFDTLYEEALDRWPEPFAPYARMREARADAARAAEAALSVSEGRDPLGELRHVRLETLVRLLRRPGEGRQAGETLAALLRAAGAQADPQQALRLRNEVERRLRMRLSDQQFALVVEPREPLARALARGFRTVAEARPLVVVLDTYEIVDRADWWLRRVLMGVGPRLLWVIAGRNNLVRDRRFGDEWFTGYASDFPSRLVDHDMRRLAEADVRAYFAAAVPERPLDEEALETISRATRGIPLAVREAADIWKRGLSATAIAGDSTDDTPRDKIVEKMTARYLLHCLHDEADRRALYTLAMARGDEPLLRALLEPEPTPTGAPPPQQEPELNLTALRQLFAHYFSEEELAQAGFRPG